MPWYRRRKIWFFCIVLALALIFGAWQLPGLFWLGIFNEGTTVEDIIPGRIAEIITNGPGSAASDGAGSVAGGIGDTGTQPGSREEGDTGTQPDSGEEGDTGTQPDSGEEGSPPPALVQILNNSGNLLYINTDISYGTVFPGENISGEFTVYLTTETQLNYIITLALSSNITDKDMRPYLMVYKDASENETEPDPLLYGITDNATGTLDSTISPPDTIDKWFVNFIVPDELGYFGAKILISVIPE